MIAALVFAVGLALLVVGAALVYVPAAFFVCGSALTVAAWLYVRGAKVSA